MESIIECVKRTYNIHTNGIKIQVESDTPLSKVITAKLLENDSEIKDVSSLLENCKILDVEKVIKKISTNKKSKESPKRKLKIQLKTPRKKKSERHIAKEVSSEKIKREESIGKQQEETKTLTPYQRVNMMATKMQGDFTRVDYQKFIEDSGYKISNFAGHNDIEDAVGLKIIGPTGEKIGRGLVKYRVIEARPIEERIYRKMIRNYRATKRHKNITTQASESKPEDISDGDMLTPCQRLNMLIKMQGEFTRLDYQKLLEDSGYKISTFMGHGDIEDAMMLRRIQPVGKRVPKQFVKYVVIDTRPIEEYTYRKTIKNHKSTKDNKNLSAAHKNGMIQVEA